MPGNFIKKIIVALQLKEMFRIKYECMNCE